MTEPKEKLERENETAMKKKKRSRSFHLISSLASVTIGVLAFVTWKQLNTREVKSQRQLNFWPCVIDAWNENDNLRTMKRVSDRLGYKIVNGSNGEAWDVLWSIESLFDDLPNMFLDLEPHQLINHFPPITFMTHKMLVVAR